MLDSKFIRCSRCILPQSTPNIQFDDAGVCSYCHDYEFRTVQGEEALIKLLNENRATNGQKYDCMAPVSGGRDSTFLLWKLVHDYKMNPLAVHYDNPFSSKQAEQNLETATKQLGIDLIKWTFKDKYHEKETRKALKIWSRKPSHSMLSIICAVCKGWWPNFVKIAREKNISLIVIGSNPYESASFKEASFGSARTYFKLNHLPKTVKKGLGELISNPAYLTCSWPAVMRMGTMASHSSPIFRFLYKDINVVRLFDYIKWNEAHVLSTISENLGWEKDPEHASPWRFDCRLDHVKKFLYKVTIGVSELEDLFSKLIREGMMTRGEALERLKTEDITPFNTVGDVLDQINLKLADLNWPEDWLVEQSLNNEKTSI